MKNFFAAFLLFFSAHATAEDFSDNSLSWRYGSRFSEPFINRNIAKNILSFTHAGGYRYGSNFLNVDALFSDSNDPASATSSAGAREVYVVYRHTLDMGALAGREIKFGPVRGLGLSAGFDLNAKNDSGYNSRKRMLVLGPTLMLDVPGYLNVSLLALWESNNPSASAGAFNPGYPGKRYYYRMHPDLNLVWGIPLGSLPLSFEGYADYIAAKGRDELGNATAPETNIDMQVMYDLCAVADCAKKTWRMGLEYQYWVNKFGNSAATVGSAGGSVARTPMIRFEYHF